MKFDDKVRLMINEAEVPECLSPENISLMLRNEMAKKEKAHVSSAISMKTNKRAIITRYTVAIAACIALALGVTAFVSDDSAQLPIGYTEKDSEIKEAQDYSDVYNVLFDNFVKNGTSFEGIEEPTTGEKVIDNTTNTETIVNDKKEDTKISAYPIEPKTADEIASADILKTDGNNLYYVANESLKVISSNNGDMSLIDKINSNYTPIEMYIHQNRLVLISNSTTEVPYSITEQKENTSVTDTPAAASMTDTSDSTPVQTDVSSDTDVSNENTDATSNPAQTEVSSETPSAETTGTTSPLGADEKPVVPTSILQTSTVIEIYDISDINNISLTSEFKQNGHYISSKIVNGSLFIVTNHSNYQTKPLENEADLDNYVPAYYINGQKTFIDPKSIFIPSKVKSTSFTIVSSVSFENGVNLTSIKAVLGESNSAYFTDKSLYVMGNSSAVGEKQMTSIIKFNIGDGNVSYAANTITEGSVANDYAMCEHNGIFTIVTNVSTAKSNYADLFVFDSSLNLTGSSTISGNVTSLRFDESKVYVNTSDSDKCTVIDFADVTKPSKQNQSLSSDFTGIFKFTDSDYLSIGTEYDQNGNKTGTKVTSYTLNGNELTATSSVSLPGFLNSDTVNKNTIDRESIFLDQEGNLGIATSLNDQYGVKNSYYIVGFSAEKQLEIKYNVEYKDIKNSDFAFNRAITVNDVFYILSNGRIISTQITDLKVIESLSF